MERGMLEGRFGSDEKRRRVRIVIFENNGPAAVIRTAAGPTLGILLVLDPATTGSRRRGEIAAVRCG